MSDWEDLCGYCGVANNGDSDWLEGMADVSSETYEVSTPKQVLFDNLQETRAYAMENPGSVFTRNTNGAGFMLKRPATERALKLW